MGFENKMLKDIMRVLELFSGTGSVGKMCKELGWEVISLDLKGADINTNILQWDYTQFPEGHFDIVWASPPCDTFSNLRRSWVGRKMKCHDEVCTLAMLENDMNTIGVPILERTEEIIDYFKPKKYFIENPQTGRMKDFMMHHKHYDVDYCRYSDWGYRKRTRIWTNVEGFIPKICDGQCGSVTNGKHVVSVATQRLSNKYRIPPLLVRELLTL